jgi:hypothetical protein
VTAIHPLAHLPIRGDLYIPRLSVICQDGASLPLAQPAEVTLLAATLHFHGCANHRLSGWWGGALRLGRGGRLSGGTLP